MPHQLFSRRNECRVSRQQNRLALQVERCFDVFRLAMAEAEPAAVSICCGCGLFFFCIIGLRKAKLLIEIHDTVKFFIIQAVKLG